MNGLFTLSQDAIPALVQVIMIDLVLAGDNAVVIGLAIILYVACDMISRGGHEVWPHLFG